MRFVKRALGLFAALGLATFAFTAVPGLINYQGRLTDNSPQQNPIDATVSIQFSIWDSQSGGTLLWTETQSVQVVKGLFSVLLGSVNPGPTGAFSGGTSRFLEIQVGGEVLTPRQRIVTAPYAAEAGSAADAENALALGGVSASSYQQRIANPCPAGYAINAVAADGTATCIQGVQGPPGPPGAGLETGAISGTVTNCDGAPMVGILVYVPGRSATAYSAGDGSYLLSYLPAGSYGVQYRPLGTNGASSASGVAVTAGQTTVRGATNVADMSSDAANCGSCGAACSSNHVTPQCASSVCVGACSPGFGDCNSNKLTDGCETSLTSVSHCGGCGLACSTNHATPACTSGFCTATCDSGFSNCDGNTQSNGCETSTTADVNNCGGCNTVCSSNNIPTPSCAASVCNGTCASGFGDCNGNKQFDGCEVNITSTVAHCGACAAACSSNNITPACTGGNCTGTCTSAFNDCDGNKRTNGCETNVTNNVSNCGFCGGVCSSNNITPSCNAGVCNGTCNAGFADCDSNKRTNGCEVNTNTNVNNCGGCGIVCPGGQSCVAGSCV